MVLVSICIPTYNNVEEVKILIESISQQTLQDYEILLSDDSTNNEIEDYIKAQRIVPQDRISYTHNPKPLGHIFNWNQPLKQAQGKYIKIMFSDDYFTFPDSLEKLVSLLEKNPRAVFGFCGSRQLLGTESRDRRASEGYVQGIREDYRDLFLSNQIGAPSTTIYKNMGVLFEEDSNWASDMFLYFNVFEKQKEIAPDTMEDGSFLVATEEPLVTIVEHAEQYTHSFQEYDERKLTDYGRMYHRYHLDSSEACRRFYLDKILRHKKHYKTAKAEGFSLGEYYERWKPYVWEFVIKNYWFAFWNKFKKRRG